MKYAVGIVGSTVESIAAILSEDGQFLAACCGKGLNLQEFRLVDFYRNLSTLVADLASAASIPHDTSALNGSAVCCAVGGIHNDYDETTVTKCLSNTILRESKIEIITDRGYVAFLATFGRRLGDSIVVKCGTDSFAFALDQNGTPIRAGGWGFLSGDDGGGFSIGANALELVFEEFDGRLPTSVFGRQFCDRLKVGHQLELISWLTNIRERNILKTSVSDLSIAVTHLAEIDQNVTALHLLDRSAQSIERCVDAVAVKLAPHQPAIISLQGGVLQNNRSLFVRLADIIRRRWPECNVVRARFRPVVGSLVRAMDVLGTSTRCRDSFLTAVESAPPPQLLLLQASYTPSIEEEVSEWLPQF